MKVIFASLHECVMFAVSHGERGEYLLSDPDAQAEITFGPSTSAHVPLSSSRGSFFFLFVHFQIINEVSPDLSFSFQLLELRLSELEQALCNQNEDMELRCHLALGIGLIVPQTTSISHVHQTKLTVRLSLFSGEIHLDNQHAHLARGSYTRALELARQRTQTDRVIAAHLGLGAALMRTAANEALSNPARSTSACPPCK